MSSNTNTSFQNPTSQSILKGSGENEPPPETSVSLMPVVISHVADFYRRYSGEPVLFHTRIQVLKTVPGLTLEVMLPPEISFNDAPVEFGHSQPWLESRREDGQENMIVIWDIGRCEAGTCLDYSVAGQITRLRKDSLLESVATVMLMDEAPAARSLSASARIQVGTKSDYLRYLPGIYQKDDFMGRFLMLFESFWKPLEEQINQIPSYFDPQMAPPALLPWLASVLNLDLNPNWPEERKRDLLKNAAKLYRRRGTKRGLKEYLEICTGGKVEITEHHGKNMILGPQARLGTGIALGKDNKAHTFTVALHSLPSTNENADVGGEDYERWIRAIIDTQSPAHTKYNLEIEPEKEKEEQSE